MKILSVLILVLTTSSCATYEKFDAWTDRENRVISLDFGGFPSFGTIDDIEQDEPRN